ncbi:MAG: cation transporter [Defluviitaleaceae bacterium]|nr:cation transporter [Defluviitaleaceae bacterium]
MQEIILQVNGMTCAHCEKAVINALTDLGVKTVKASAKKGTVSIAFFPEKVTLDAIKIEIKEMGYDV